MRVKKIGLLLVMLLVFYGAYGDETPHFEKCLRWTHVCQQKKDCTQPEDTRYGCYHCIKPGHYGFHIYPTQIKRMSCNAKTVDYLRNMGYNCNKQPAPELKSCSKLQKKTMCESKCVEYAKSE